MHRLLLGLLSTFLAACSPSERPLQAEASPPRAASQATRVTATAHTGTPSVTTRDVLPDKQRVIDEIARNAPLDAGTSTPEFWTGYSYAFEGVPHYTGFAYFPSTATTEGATLGQATFLASGSKSPVTWETVVSEPGIATFGARGRAFGVDPERAIVSAKSTDERIVLAIPVDGAIEQGVVPKLYEVLFRTPDARWHYAGELDAGADDGAGCDEGRTYPCAPVRGTLHFEAGARMPTIAIQLEGPGANETRTVRYRFDEGARVYASLP